ncbi:MAG: glycosyltransferase family 2 protein [Acidithiobacillales bacterium]
MTVPGAPPRVSVIVRTRDRPGLLAEALDSLRSQSFPDFETVVVNGGGELPPSILAPAPGRGLDVVVPPPPAGRARSLNAGLAAARGLYVAYLDDDDLYRPAHLARLVAALERNDGCGAAFSSVDQIAQRRGPDGLYRDGETLTTYGRPFDASRILYKNDVPLIALMHRRELVEMTGPFDEAFDLFEDWDFLIRLSAVTRLRFVPETTAVYRVRDDGTNATMAAPWGGPEAEAAREALFSKHAARRTSGTAMALVDGFDDEVKALRSRLAEAEGSLARLQGALADAEGRAAALAAEHDAIHRSRWWRLATRWWKLKAFLSK